MIKYDLEVKVFDRDPQKPRSIGDQSMPEIDPSVPAAAVIATFHLVLRSARTADRNDYGTWSDVDAVFIPLTNPDTGEVEDGPWALSREHSPYGYYVPASIVLYDNRCTNNWDADVKCFNFRRMALTTGDSQIKLFFGQTGWGYIEKGTTKFKVPAFCRWVVTGVKET